MRYYTLPGRKECLYHHINGEKVREKYKYIHTLLKVFGDQRVEQHGIIVAETKERIVENE